MLMTLLLLLLLLLLMLTCTVLRYAILDRWRCKVYIASATAPLSSPSLISAVCTHL